MRAPVLALGGLVACKSGAKPDAAPPAVVAPVVPPDAGPPAPASASINEFVARGTPTFVLGTSGDDRADRAIASQVELVKNLVFPDAAVVLDTAVDPARWPALPAVYGGPHVNALVASLSLPFTLGPGHLEIGGQTFDGDEYQIITVVPADAHHPELLLFAGTGTPGITQINDQTGGADMITIKDRFGILRTGTWKDGVAVLGPPTLRIAWRSVDREGGSILFPEQLAAAPGEAAQVEAAERGFATARAKLGVVAPPRVSLYVYPDLRSKKTLTRDPRSGVAVLAANALHVLSVPPADLERLVAHESSHAYAHHAWGDPGTPLIGEGLAVWTSGFYAGRSLDDWAGALRDPPSIAQLVAGFFTYPEPVGYPLGGLVVEAAVALVGFDAMRTHLYPATPSTWDAACRAAGTTPEALQAALDARLR